MVSLEGVRVEVSLGCRADEGVDLVHHCVACGDYLGKLGLEHVRITELVEGGFEAQVHQAFRNLKAVVEAAGGHLGQVVRLGLFLTDLKQFATVNSIMAEYFHAPYPARSTVQVAALPKGAPFEVEATLVLT